MADDAHTEALSEEIQPTEDAQPDDLTVQSDAEQPELPDPDAETASAEVEAAAGAEAEPAQEAEAGDEPESRLMLENTQDAPERADYQPLFMAPQPIRVAYEPDDDDDDDDDDDSDDSTSDSDDDQSDRPSGRRRRAGPSPSSRRPHGNCR